MRKWYDYVAGVVFIVMVGIATFHSWQRLDIFDAVAVTGASIVSSLEAVRLTFFRVRDEHQFAHRVSPDRQA